MYFFCFCFSNQSIYFNYSDKVMQWINYVVIYNNINEAKPFISECSSVSVGSRIGRITGGILQNH